MEDRFPLPLDGRELAGAERAAAARLLELAEVTVSNASLRHTYGGGLAFMYAVESVETWAGADEPGAETIELTRRPIRSDMFTLIQDTNSHQVGLNETHMALDGKGVEALVAAGAAIATCEKLGTHRVSALKILEEGGQADPFFFVEVEMNRISEGALQPKTVLNLRAVRGYDGILGALIQTCTLESNPNTGSLIKADGLDGGQMTHMEGMDTSITNRWQTANDPFSEASAMCLQEYFNPPTPADRPLQPEEWQRLLTEQLHPHDLLGPQIQT